MTEARKAFPFGAWLAALCAGTGVLVAGGFAVVVLALSLGMIAPHGASAAGMPIVLLAAIGSIVLAVWLGRKVFRKVSGSGVERAQDQSHDRR